MDAPAEIGRNPVGKHQTQPGYRDELADAGRNCRTRLARPNSQARTGTGKFIFSVQLTTSRICNLTRFILTLAICVTILHTYTHTYMACTYPYQASGSVPCVSTSQVIKYASNNLHLKCPSWVACVKYVTIVVCFTGYKSGRKPTAHQSLMSCFSVICL